MPNQERIAAVKAKLDEVFEDMLSIASNGPEAVNELLKGLGTLPQSEAPWYPRDPESGYLGSHCFFRTEMEHRDGRRTVDDVALENVHAVERRKIDHDQERDELVLLGSVFCVLAFTPPEGQV